MSPEDRSMRMPPYNAEAESSLIGAVLEMNEKYHEVSPVVGPGDFFDARKGEIWRLVRARMDADGALDAVGLANAMAEAGMATSENAFAEAFGLERACPSPLNAPLYASIVKQKSIARKLISVGDRLHANGYGNSMSGDDQVDAAERAVFAVASEARSGDSATAREAVTESYWQYLSRLEGVVPGIPTGFAEYDDLTGGWAGSQFIIVGGRPSQGKTSFVLNVCDHLARLDPPVPTYFASLEMTKKDLGDRLIVGRARVPGESFRLPRRLTEEERGRVDVAVRDLSTAPIYIDDNGRQTVSQIVSSARRHKIEHGIRLVVVDYIQFVTPAEDEAHMPRREQVANMSKRFKQLAKDLDLPVVVLSQLNRENEKREDHRPRMSDLAESGAIERDADLIAFLHRPEYYDKADQPGMAELIIAKNRAGPVGTIPLRFNKSQTRFANPDEDDSPNFDPAVRNPY